MNEGLLKKERKKKCSPFLVESITFHPKLFFFLIYYYFKSPNHLEIFVNSNLLKI